MAKRRPAFTKFMKRALEPGPIKDRAGEPLDVQRLEGVRGLGGMDRTENDYLCELELVPLPSDNARQLLDEARKALARLSGRT